MAKTTPRHQPRVAREPPAAITSLTFRRLWKDWDLRGGAFVLQQHGQRGAHEVPSESFRCLLGFHTDCPGSFQARPPCTCNCHGNSILKGWDHVKKFWIVVSSQGNGTHARRHDKIEDAVSEASVAANQTKDGTEYVIMEAVKVVKLPTPPAEVVDLS